MNGPADLGGRMGFGALPLEENEPLFHGDWEKRVLGLTLACGALGYWNIDESRHARESILPADYYGSSYYEIWLRGLIRLLGNHNELSGAEMAAGKMAVAGRAAAKKLLAKNVQSVLSKGGPTLRALKSTPRFAIGDRVHTINRDTERHTRLPSYARDKTGVIEAYHGAHVFPDTNAHGAGENPAHLYTVAFDGRTLWGPDSDPELSVSIEAWEPYLEHA